MANCGTVPRTTVKVLNLGLTRFQQSLNVQQHFSRQLLAYIGGTGPVANNTLLLQQHHPVYTVGIRSKDYTPDLQEKLRQTGAEFHVTNRGGLITFHGPGQLVAYPILNLRDFKLTMKCYIDRLENTIIDMCEQYDIRAGKSPPHTGVWVGNNKIAAIGVHGSRYVTTHGVAINVDPDLSWFEHIVPCGIHDRGVTSLVQQAPPPSPQTSAETMESATQAFITSFQKLFNCDLENEELDNINEIMEAS